MDTIEVNGTEGVMDADAIEITQNGVVEEQAPVEEDDSAPTYAEAFPPLGGGVKPEEASGSAWSKNSSAAKKATQAQVKKPIQSSLINTVLRVPYEERRYKNLMPVIGDGVRQNEQIKDVMQKNQHPDRSQCNQRPEFDHHGLRKTGCCC